MALLSDAWKKITAAVESAPSEYQVTSNALKQAALEMSIEQDKYNALADQYRGMQNTPSGFQNALVQKGPPPTAQEIAIQQQQMEQRIAIMQAQYDQKFREEAYIKGAVSSEELDSVAYSLSLEEVRTIWLAAFGSRWVAQESMEGDHRLMFQRLFQNDQFESATVTDPTTRTFKIRYRLRGT